MRLTAVALLATLAVASSAHATPLAPGSTVVPNGVTGFQGLTKISSTEQSIVFDTTSGSDRLYGVLSSTVYKSNSTGFLTFTYQVTVFNSDTVPVTRVFNNNFGNGSTTTDVSYLIDAGSIAHPRFPPATADRSASGTTVGFNFSPALLPNQGSDLLIVATNSTTYKSATTYVTSGSLTTGVSSFAVTPEPSTLVLGALAIPAFGFVIRRKRRQS